MEIVVDIMTSKIVFEESEQPLVPIVHKAMHEQLGVKQDGYFFSKAYKMGFWDGLVDFYDKENDNFHTGLLSQVDAILGELQSRYTFSYKITDDRPDPFLDVSDLPKEIKLIGDGDEDITLRDYQYNAVASAIDQQVGIVEASTNSGKCITSDTLINTSEGIKPLAQLFKDISEPLDTAERVIPYTGNHSLINRYGKLEKPSHLTVNGKKPVYMVKTNNGAFVNSTSNHPYLVVSATGVHKWVETKDLKIGDWVVFRKGTDTFGSSAIDNETAKALGMLVADGYFGDKSRLSFFNNQNELIQVVEKLFNSYGRTYCRDREGTSCIYLYLSDKVGATKLHSDYELGYGVAKDKEIPKVILTGNRSTQLAFISGYLECECNIDSKKGYLEVISASQKLMQQLQLMLLNLGYASRLTDKKVKGYEHNWYGRLYIGGSELERLFRELTFLTKQRNDSVDSFYVNYKNRKRNLKGQVAPYGKELVANYKKTYIGDSKGIGRSYSVPKTISLTRLRSMIAEFPEGEPSTVDTLLNLVSEEFCYSQIVSVDYVGDRPTYDVCMPITHSFIANGMINHNTEIAAGIIQQILPYLESGERVAFFTHNSSIFNQSIERVERRLGIKVGRYGLGKKDFQQVTFVMIPTVNSSLNADPEKGLKLTGKNAITKKIAKEIVPNMVKGYNQRFTLRNLIKNYPNRTKVDQQVVSELEDVLYTCGTDNEIKLRIKGYEAEYQAIIEKKNGKVLKKYQDAIDFLESVAVMLVDEAHHTSADTWYQSLTKCVNAQYRIALTGSIDRKDHMLWQRMQAIFNKTITKVSNEEMIKRGFSAKPKITMFPIVSPQGYEKADYMPAREICIVNNEYRNTLITQLAKKSYEEGKGVLILVSIIEHGEKLSELLSKLTVEHSFIHGDLDIDYRESQLSAMRAGHLKVLIATTIVDEGVDISGIDVLILGAGGKSLRQTLQRVGRALRKKKIGENKATIIDFIDYTNEHLLNHSKERRKTYVNEGFEIQDIKID